MPPSNHTYGPTCRLAQTTTFFGSIGDDDVPPLKAQFFYSSPLPIDDPLIPIPTLSGDLKSAKHPPRPFSPYDNNTLEEAWLSLGPLRSKKSHRKLSSNHTRSQEQDDEGNTSTKQVGSDINNEGDGDGIRNQSKSQASTAAEACDDHEQKPGKRSRGISNHDRTSRNAEALNRDNNAVVLGTSIPSEIGTTGFPFQRAPSRTRSPTPRRPSTPVSSSAIQSEDIGFFESNQRKPKAGFEDLSECNETAEVHRCKAQKHAKDTASIPVGISRLHLVDLPALQMMPLYWSPVHDIAGVIRGTWFYRDTMYPVEPPVANQLEMGYRELRPWSRTWRDELKSALALGADGEEKISHLLWPKDEKSGSLSKGRLIPPPTDPECAARCFNGEVAAEGTVDPLRPGERNVATAEITRRYPTSHVIYEDSHNAYILKPSLQPSAYYGRKPLAKIKKGIPVGIHVVRGFDWPSWEKIHPSHKSASALKAEESAAASDTATASKGSFCNACAVQQERPKVTDLVLVIHGIGQKLSERVESFHFTHAINSFRRSVNMELSNKRVQSVLREDFGSIMVLPVNWRSNLSFEEGGPMKTPDEEEHPIVTDFSLKDITPDTIPTVRNLISDVMLDIPFYMSNHKPKMIEALIFEANRVYRLWCQNNPDFHKEGRVHIIAHSLGSAMALDALSKQPTTLPDVDLLSSKVHTKHFDFDTKNLFFVGSPAGFFLLLEKGKLMPRKGRNKPGAEHVDQDKAVASSTEKFGCLAIDNLYNVMVL